MNLILASSSPARAVILEKLHLPFKKIPPNIDESVLPNELPEALVKRLSEQKARAVATQHTHPNTLIIGSDQVAVLPDGQILGKPHTFEKAVMQLTQMSGQCIHFHSGLCLLDTGTQKAQVIMETTDVYFRTLTKENICAYLDKEHPFQCAGSFRSEGLGIALVEKYVGKDPNALIGLPLIELVTLLKNIGLDILR